MTGSFHGSLSRARKGVPRGRPVLALTGSVRITVSGLGRLDDDGPGGIVSCATGFRLCDLPPVFAKRGLATTLSGLFLILGCFLLGIQV